MVWTWFGFRKSDKLQVSACCKLCRRVVPTSCGNTSNLFQHLKQFHYIEHSESQKMRHQKRSSQPVPKTSPASASAKENPMQQSPVVAFMPYDKQSKRHTDITKAVTNFLANDAGVLKYLYRYRNYIVSTEIKEYIAIKILAILSSTNVGYIKRKCL